MDVFDPTEIRENTLRVVKDVFAFAPDHLPLLDDFALRPVQVIADRILCLHVAAAVSYGLNREKARAWILEEGLAKSLAATERSFVFSGSGQVGVFRARIEGIWALAWLLSIVPDIDFSQECDVGLALELPDLKSGESSAAFRQRARLRSKREVAAECDLAYCLHWALRQTLLNRKRLPAAVAPDVVEERRRALEWAIADGSYDDISLDT